MRENQRTLSVSLYTKQQHTHNYTRPGGSGSSGTTAANDTNSGEQRVDPTIQATDVDDDAAAR